MKRGCGDRGDHKNEVGGEDNLRVPKSLADLRPEMIQGDLLTPDFRAKALIKSMSKKVVKERCTVF